MSAPAPEERLDAWLAANPGSKGWQDDDGWRGTIDVDATRWLAAGPCDTLDGLIAALQERAADVAEVRAIEAEHPGWLHGAGQMAHGRLSGRSATTSPRRT